MMKAFFFFLICPFLFGASDDLEFKARNYSKTESTIKGNGAAWVKRGTKQIWADSIEVDLTTKRLFANGNVHIVDGVLDMWCRHADYNLNGADGVVDDATVSLGQLIITGKLVKKLSDTKFEVEEGSFTNCNIDLVKDPKVGQCPFDWKVYGKKLSVTVEEYAQVEDAILYAKEIPIGYLPYLIVPVKTKRQTGFIKPAFSTNGVLGNGFNLPFFLDLGTWQDLTLDPTYYTRVGYHIGFDYRYVYNPIRQGEIKINFLQTPFGVYREDSTGAPAPSRYGGLFGEWGIYAKNEYGFNGRAQTRQSIKLVSDPYYTRYFSADFPDDANSAYYRSMMGLTLPYDNQVFQGLAQHTQSLIISKDSGVDRGPVLQLPSLFFSQTTTPLISRWLALEFDTIFSNYYRPTYGFDNGPLNPDPNYNYQSGNYIRTGQRWLISPKLVFTVPVAKGLQFQPNVKSLSLLYHFDYPASSYSQQHSVIAEIPFSLYLSRKYQTSITGFEKINHVFQPRISYANSFYQVTDPNHPFFFVDTTNNFSNPRFDFLDQIAPVEYLRFELINRFLRKTQAGETERFFLVQLSQQYNNRLSSIDPRATKRMGPIELLGEFKMWRLTSQFQAIYQFEGTDYYDTTGAFIRRTQENMFSGSIAYQDPDGDVLALTGRFQARANDSLSEQTLLVNFNKVLPMIINLSGGFEYSFQKNDLLGYSLSFSFATKPRSCWNLVFTAGRDSTKNPFTNVAFKLDMGGPALALTPR